MIQGFQAVATDTRTVVALHTRYVRVPMDDSTVLTVSHRTIGGGASFLLEREQFAQLRTWLDGDRAQELRFEDSTHYVVLRISGSGTIIVSAGWKSASGAHRSGQLTPEDTSALTTWVADKDDHGWAGWLVPPAGSVCRCTRHCPLGTDCPADGSRHLHGATHTGCPAHRSAFTMRNSDAP